MASIETFDRPVYVYEKPVRLWHWINALAIVVLAVTGYLIAWPPVVTAGEASDHYLTGYVRFVHFSAGYVLAVGLIGRAYWALVGNRYARELFAPRIHDVHWWQALLHEVRWYLFLVEEPGKHAGHNPLAGLAMFLFYVLGSLFMITTGFALYGEGLGAGSWAANAFGWVLPALGGSQQVHSLHHLGMWYLVIFTLIHVYVAVREQHLSRQSVITTMIDGWRVWKDDRP
ncbi:Ni/Fe-hydrogenase, b-type cytochrome subunit [Methylococcus capsulatus]|uniref:Ni/Fe-hydrogenase, b-type cytochrome subunit n=1 Tax=Methylococcus capsulatus TaxID=414 RepID=UPI001C531EFC|nr:Ni/Fe-hydrogenase, b-type cytochrome subunit [Methylococcus capsulatus]QXP93985.1 Ni/Fe-hydrogenase, b-type cytochrome subunit [Methylococcus capsulatus]UQN11282.1 Ni/Fe-hydrogenase, b-type cytochrome subunit [Methylococcus capsulatus]